MAQIDELTPETSTATSAASASPEAPTARLSLGGKSYDLPVVVGDEGEVGIDITQLRAKSGAITLDQGYANTGACLSAVTFIDGEKGILRYRGYPIEEIAGRAQFTEICYLLVYGHLPNGAELAEFRDRLTRHSLVHEDMKKFFESYPPNAHPMAILSSMVASLSTYYPETGTAENVDLNIIRLLAKAKTIAAFSYKKNIGQPFIYPQNDLSYCANFIYMMFAVPSEPYKVSPVLELPVVAAVGLDVLQHLDHLLVGAAVERPPEGADPGGDRGEEVGLAAPHHAHGRGAAVLLVVGVEDQEEVERPLEHRRDLVGLGRHREHHVEEVGAVGEVVLGIDERLADVFLVREGGDRLRLGEEANDVQVDVLRRPGLRVVGRE